MSNKTVCNRKFCMESIMLPLNQVIQRFYRAATEQKPDNAAAK